MRITLDRKKAKAFLDSALTANVIYFRVRREIFELLADSISPAGDVSISYETYIGLRSFLQCRNEDESDNKRLAFDKGLEEIHKATYIGEIPSPAPSRGAASEETLPSEEHDSGQAGPSGLRAGATFSSFE